MSVRELARMIGKKALWKAGTMAIEVEILDVRIVYGRVQYLIRPVSGSGEDWTETVSQPT